MPITVDIRPSPNVEVRFRFPPEGHLHMKTIQHTQFSRPRQAFCSFKTHGVLRPAFIDPDTNHITSGPNHADSLNQDKLSVHSKHMQSCVHRS